MTSEHTKEATENFFMKNDYFGLQKENIVLFEQGLLPCFAFDGKIILDSKSKVAQAPGKYHLMEMSKKIIKKGTEIMRKP